MYVIRRTVLKFRYFLHFKTLKSFPMLTIPQQPVDCREPRSIQGEGYFFMDTVALFVTQPLKIIQRHFCLKLVCHWGVCTGCLNLSRQWSEDVINKRTVL